jgi:thioredoxin 1
MAENNTCGTLKGIFMKGSTSPMRNRNIRIAVLIFGLLLAPILVAPAEGQQVYPEDANAKADVHNALVRARNEHKRIILDFGGNWCPDCKVLDIYFHDPANAPILNANFILVHINIGRYDQNLDLAEKYQVPLKKGVPALAVLDSDGKLLFSQRTGEFEAMRNMASNSVTNFLVKWKSSGPCSVVVARC